MFGPPIKAMRTLLLLPLLLYLGSGTIQLLRDDLEYVDEIAESDDASRISVCDFGWTPFGGQGDDQFQWCIRSFDYYKNDWDHADNICAHYSGRLVSVVDSTLYKALEKEIQLSLDASYTFKRVAQGSHFSMWVGLGQICPKPSDKANDLPTLRWTDGRRFDPNKEDKVAGLELDKSRARNESKENGRYCVALNLRLNKDSNDKSSFVLSPCDDYKPFVCMKTALRRHVSNKDAEYLPIPAFDKVPDEIFAKKYSNEELTKEDPCGPDPNWCPLEKKDTKEGSKGTMCYRILRRNEHFKMSDASCERHKGTLVSVHDTYEQDFLGQLAAFGARNVAEDKYMYWIGLHQNNAERMFSWSDGSVMDYFADLSFPKEQKDVEMNDKGNCFALRLVYDKDAKQTYNTWIRQRCDNRLMAMCQKKGYGYEEKKKAKGKKTWRHENTKCPEGWRLYNSMCYRVFGTEKDKALTYDKARESCPHEGNLASITDPFEQAFVVSLLGEAKKDAWIGMEIKSGRMMWADQEPISFTKFAPSHRMIKVNPEKYLLQNEKTMGFTQDACVSMDGTKMVGYWDTTFSQQSNVRAIFGTFMSQSLKEDPLLEDTCNKKKLPYICEKFAEKGEEKEAAPLPFDAKCETLETASTTYCFLRTSLRNPLTHSEAQQTCKLLKENEQFKEFFSDSNQQSQVAVVDDVIEWSFLMAHAFHHKFEEFWMGYNFSEAIGFQRVDGGQINIGPWDQEEPNTQNGKCVQTRLGRQEAGAFWQMEDCRKEKAVVCRITDKLPKPVDNKRKCPKGKENWIKGKTRCYFLNSNASMISTGYKADHDCFRYHNASLASFPTLEDFDAFRKYHHAQQLVVETAFIGLVNQDGKYGYTDHSPVSYTNWAPGHPTPSRGRITREDCVHMKLSGDFQWQNENCWTSKHYVCSVATELVQSDAKDKGEPDPKKKDDEPASNKKDDENPTLPPETKEDSEVDPESAQPAPDAAPRPSNAEGHKEESSGWVTVTLLCILGVVVASAVVVFRLRRKHIAARMREHQIMQFDTLQNEDDEGL
ncbi:hypothetical protein QR680_013491 [Steinernema hermaphroditum]|uniref:C-type lectin domain-containing protein n=1 Tax=Steinernema hermaphroditum TaxID=289476 RepID=A0AA39M2F6_9BILA|nr:hypothetical protein QR680_013491 [Steinernema hermaphroditum]